MPEPPARFDLVEEPWLPCETPAGERIELGIRTVLHRAHELAALHDESPLVTAVLHRLLLAILDRALQPKTRDDWLALWRAERLPAAEIDAYLEKWKERFDLFHPKRPFMQVAGLEEKLLQDRLARDKEKAKPNARRCGEW
jgi:CRISPR system Cascade subunit CasA